MQSFAHFSLFCALNLRVMKKNIAIFASGSGSNTENIIRYFRENEAIQVSLVLSNRSDAYVLERAHRLGVPCNVFPKEDWMAGDEILFVNGLPLVIVELKSPSREETDASAA